MTETTNAERLAQIKLKHAISMEINDDFAWLIEQAERAQELEKAFHVENNLYNNAYDDAVRMDKENKRLREALVDLKRAIGAELSPMILNGARNYISDKVSGALEGSE